MKKFITSILILNLNSNIRANHEVISESDHVNTDLSHSTSTKTNFTLSEYMGQTTILELWSELLPLPDGGTQQRLDGKLYILNANLYSQNFIGKLDYRIDIGLHDADQEKLIDGVDGPVYMSDRDWISLRFSLKDMYSVGNWTCRDEYSDYGSTPRYDLDDTYPNVLDFSQDCTVSNPTMEIIGDVNDADKTDKINLSVEFNKYYDTGDQIQDIKLVANERLGIQTRLTDELSPENQSYNSWTDFVWVIPELSLMGHGTSHDLAHMHSQREVNWIISLLIIGSCGIIFTCKFLDEREEKLAK